VVESSTMKKLIFMAVLLCSFSTFAQNLESRCQATPSTVNITADTSMPVNINQDKSYKEQTEETLPYRKSHVKKESITWGLTVATYLHDTSYNNTIVDLKGDMCVVPGIEIKLSFKNIVINLAKELPPKSCIYNYILEHESHHVEIYKKGLDQMALDLTQLFQEKYVDKRFYNSNSAVADKEAQAYTDSFYDEAIRNGVKKISQEHNNFDSAQEYARAVSACNHALRKLY
jgi:hypothetical protein